MSKKSLGMFQALCLPPRRVLLVLLCFCLVAAATIGPSMAQRAPQQTDAGTAAARSTALIAATAEVLKETSSLRQLAILRPVHSSAQSRAEIEQMIIRNLDRDTTPAEMHASEVTLKKLGLAPAGFQLRPLIVRLLTEQVAGYYDPRTQEFHLADWIDVEGQRPIMAHELTHALQDQHFNLRRFENWPKGDSDAQLAAHALIEGDATLTMTQYVLSNTTRALGFLKSLATSEMSSEELNRSPRVLRDTLLFPYQEGLIWTRALYQMGGWKEVSEAFTTLPRSTEQILHPEKFFVREPPVKVSLPELRASFGRGWRLVDSDVNGEWTSYLILDQFLKSPADSKRAAGGWGGDRYAVYESRRGQIVYVALSAWDTERDAREFFDAWAKRSALRYPQSQMIFTSSDKRLMRTAEGSVLMEIRGKRVLVIEGLTGTVRTRAVSQLVWPD